jgi:hypothetical protein
MKSPLLMAVVPSFLYSVPPLMPVILKWLTSAPSAALRLSTRPLLDCVSSTVVALVTEGVSATGVTFSVVVVLSVFAPPLPLLPPSSMPTVRVTAVVALLAVVKVTLLAAMKALMLLTLPVRVRAELVPPAVTPPPLVAASDPLPTDRVAVTLPAAASASAKLMPVRALATSSVTEMPPGTVATGASLTAAMVTVRVPAAAAAFLSVAVKVTVRSPLAGASLLLLNWIARAALCTRALLALALKVMVQAVPALTLAALALPMVAAPLFTSVPLIQIAPPPGSLVGRVRLSLALALPVICAFRVPPFQSASPSVSLTVMPLLTTTAVCSVKAVLPPATTLGVALGGTALSIWILLMEPQAVPVL